MVRLKHFESDYNNLVKEKLKSNDKDEAMSQSIGGNFYHFGIFQRELLFQHGLKENSSILDFGCGSGRLANALKEYKNIDYVGIDVVQDLIDYAKTICERDDWKFVKSSDFTLPLQDDSLDMIACFSVFTHLLHEETYVYLAEMRRILKPGGKIVFSFLDFSIPEHWAVFSSNLIQLHDHIHLNQFIDPQAIHTWCNHLQLEVINVFPGNQPYISLSEPITSENGNVFKDKVSLGQSTCVVQKPFNSIRKIYTSPPPEFDGKKYLELNPDVAKSGINPEVHYISCGQFENRPILKNGNKD